MEPYFTRVSCEIKEVGVPPAIEKEYLGYYESNWDVRTNEFIKNNKEKIGIALKTYPSEYCYYDFHYASQPTVLELGTEEEKWQRLDETAEEQREETNKEEGILYCLLFQDRGKASSKRQRILVINVEDNTPQTILAAIRYMAQFADKMKKEVEHGSGNIPYRYRRPWKVDLAVEHKKLYDSAFGWLEGKNEMYFSQTILKYDEATHRLWFVDNQGNKDKEFVPHDLITQAFFLLHWNHPEGIPESDFSKADKQNDQKRVDSLIREYAEYYKILSQNRGRKNEDIAYFQKQVEFYCLPECRSERNTLKSRIKAAFKKHIKERVNEFYANKVAEYYSFGSNGKIKVINRSTTIILPDELMSDRLKKHNAEHADDADE